MVDTNKAGIISIKLSIVKDEKGDFDFKKFVPWAKPKP